MKMKRLLKKVIDADRQDGAAAGFGLLPLQHVVESLRNKKSGVKAQAVVPELRHYNPRC